jgi:glycosyltransferase 2 family protein
MQSHGRRTLQLAAGLALSGLFLWLALRGEDWGAIRENLSDVDYRYVALMVPMGAYTLYARCQRWRVLLEHTHGRRVPMLPIYSASAIGFMANMVLPFRVGEIARPWLVARSARLAVSSTFATVVVERMLDLMALGFFGIGIVLLSDVPDEVVRWAKIALLFAAAMFVTLIVIVVQRQWLLPKLDHIWRRIPKIGPILLRLEHEFVEGMAPIAHPATLAVTIAWSLWIWLTVAVSFALGFLATGMELPFLAGGITVSTIVALAVALPSAPAFVGQFEWGCKMALVEIHGISSAAAIGYSILVHTTQFLTQVALGVVFLAREGLSFRDLASLKDEADEGDEAKGTV